MPGQVEINLHYANAVDAADDGLRLKYAVRALARGGGVRATFMAKPFQGLSGSSMHLHVSLWRDDEPAFVPSAGAENTLMRARHRRPAGAPAGDHRVRLSQHQLL